MATKNLSIRIPDQLHAAIKTAADEDHRSLNGQILWMLETAMEARYEQGSKR